MERLGLLIGVALAATGSAALAQGAPGKSGEQVYSETCVACHRIGWAGAPKMGDQKTWKKLIAEGLDDIGGAAIVGVRLMPAKGGREEYSDLEVLRGTVYMANRHGASWPEPTVQDAANARADRERRNAEKAAKEKK